MNLYSAPETPVPADPAVAAITAKDGVVLRVARWSAGSASRGSIAILPGRAEFIERYFETVSDLLERRFDVVVMDWRGQGLSERQLRDHRKGHVDDFDLYQADLAALAENVLEPFCPKPWFALGHSMGGAILIAQARAGLSPFSRIVVAAPMIALAKLRFRKLTAFCMECLDILGFGGAYVPGVRRKPVFLQSFSQAALTSDAARYRHAAGIVCA
ncbi:MAG: alpha/beta hydrolase, partial [Bradyrhizobium sp.]